MINHSPPFWDAPDWDESLEKTPPAALALAVAKASLRRWVRANAQTELLSVSLIVRWHKALFRGVFPQFAGKIRGTNSPDELAIEVSFGHHHGVGHRFVSEELQAYEHNLHVMISELARYPLSPKHDFDTQVVRVAAWCHADFIRIHPFRNGNGRVGRLIVDYFAYRHGLHTIGHDRPDSNEYKVAMDYYMDHRKSDALAAFLFPLMLGSSSGTSSIGSPSAVQAPDDGVED